MSNTRCFYTIDVLKYLNKYLRCRLYFIFSCLSIYISIYLKIRGCKYSRDMLDIILS